MKFKKWKKLVLLLAVVMMTTVIVVPMTVKKAEGAALDFTTRDFCTLLDNAGASYEKINEDGKLKYIKVTNAPNDITVASENADTYQYVLYGTLVVQCNMTIRGNGYIVRNNTNAITNFPDQPMIRVDSGYTLTISGRGDLHEPLELNKENYNADTNPNPHVYGIILDGRNHTTQAPAIRCSGSIDFYNVTLRSFVNTSDDDASSGGAIATATSGAVNITMDSCAIYNCKSSRLGAGIALKGVSGTVDISKTIFVANEAGNHGGILRSYMACTMEVTLDQCVFRNNETTSSNGAAILWAATGESGSPTLLIKDCQFLDNISSGSGGALYLTGVGVTIESSSGSPTNALTNTKVTPTSIIGTRFNANKANGGSGGAIYISSNPVTVTGPLRITNNIASSNGAGIYLIKTTLSLDTPTFTSNTATENGGAIYMTNSNLNVTDGTISGNKAADGAGIYATGNSSLTMSGTTVSGNTASSDSGGIRLTDATAEFTNVSITNNSSNDYGGGLYAYGHATITMIGGMVSGNTALTGGGGITLNCNTSGNSPTISITGTVIQNNTVTNGSGGGLRLSTATATLTNVTFSGNRATDTDANGGAISAVRSTYKDSPSILTISGGSFTGNTTGNAGGAIHCNNSTLDIQNASVTSNNAKNGGGLYVSNGSTFTMDQCTFSKNTASNNGGGLHLNAVNLDLTNGTSFSQNTASANGGGIYVGAAILNMSGGTISDSPSSNTDYTARNGGGVYVSDGGTFHFSGGTIDKCYTSDGGGGVRVVGKSTMTMSGTAKITNCMTVNNGGGIYVWGPNADVSEDTVMNKEDTSVLTIDGGTISSCWVKNGNGGGIYVNGGAYCELDGGTISNNTAIKSGGGVSVRYGYFYMYDGLITNNQVTGTNSDYCGGGGIGVFGDRADQIMNVYIHGGTISDNKSSLNGGGIAAQVTKTGTKINVYVGCSECYGDHSGEVLDCANDTSGIKHTCPVITGNSAVNGGGFYLHATDGLDGASATLYLYCGSAEENTSKNSNSYNALQTGGAIHLYGFNVGSTDNPGITLIGGDFTKYDEQASWAAIEQVTIHYFLTWSDQSPTTLDGYSYYDSKISMGVALNMPAYTHTYMENAVTKTKDTVAWEKNTPSTSQYITVGSVMTIPSDVDTLYFYAVYGGEGKGTVAEGKITAGNNSALSPTESSATISADSIITVMFDITAMNPSYYEDLILMFENQIGSVYPTVGSTILMAVQIDQEAGMTAGNAKEYYYYTVTDEVLTQVDLTQFKKVGTNTAYARPDSNDYSGNTYAETFLFIIDFANELEDDATGTVKLERHATSVNDGDVATHSALFTLCANRTFTASISDTDKVDDPFTLNYTTDASDVTDDTYDENYAVLVLSPATGFYFPKDTELIVNGDTEHPYVLTANGKFIVPLAAIVSKQSLNNESFSLRLSSKNTYAITVTAEIWIADINCNLVGSAPVQSQEVELQAKTLPSLAISMTERVFHRSSLPATQTVTVTDQATAKGYTVVWSVMKKDGSAATGLTLENNILTFGTPTAGTYCIVATVKSGETEVMTVPYTFIILE